MLALSLGLQITKTPLLKYCGRTDWGDKDNVPALNIILYVFAAGSVGVSQHYVVTANLQNEG